MYPKISSKYISVSPYKYSTTSSYTFPLKINKRCRQENPSEVGVVTIKNKQDSSSFTLSSSSKIFDSRTNIADTNADIDKLNCLRHTICTP